MMRDPKEIRLFQSFQNRFSCSNWSKSLYLTHSPLNVLVNHVFHYSFSNSPLDIHAPPAEAAIFPIIHIRSNAKSERTSG
jgi:hypothetical protein